jgi:ActD protein
LPRLHHPLLKNRRFALASHDRFFIVIESDDVKYSHTETRTLLEAAGSKHIELVEA